MRALVVVMATAVGIGAYMASWPCSAAKPKPMRLSCSRKAAGYPDANVRRMEVLITYQIE